jgi:hypothetical protein
MGNQTSIGTLQHRCPHSGLPQWEPITCADSPTPQGQRSSVCLVAFSLYTTIHATSVVILTIRYNSGTTVCWAGVLHVPPQPSGKISMPPCHHVHQENRKGPVELATSSNRPKTEQNRAPDGKATTGPDSCRPERENECRSVLKSLMWSGRPEDQSARAASHPGLANCQLWAHCD